MRQRLPFARPSLLASAALALVLGPLAAAAQEQKTDQPTDQAIPQSQLDDHKSKTDNKYEPSLDNLARDENVSAPGAPEEGRLTLLGRSAAGTAPVPAAARPTTLTPPVQGQP